jgi:predicted nucleotidyltransferase
MQDYAGSEHFVRRLEQVDIISDTDRQLLRQVRVIIQQFVPTATPVLYGSVARGTQDAESD